MKKRYMVLGSVMEYMADLHCLAETEEEALVQWDKAFPDCSRESFDPMVCIVKGNSPLEKHWKCDGHKRYSGGYTYANV